MTRQQMIVSLIVLAVSGTILLGGGKPPTSGAEESRKPLVLECVTIMLVVLMSYFAYCVGVASNAVSAVRTKIDNCVAALPHDGRDK